jgi:hypothetical protein
MELAKNTLTVCFAILRIIIIRVCVKIFVMAQFILIFFFQVCYFANYLLIFLI